MTESSNKVVLEVSIRIKGDFADDIELPARHKIVDELEDRKIGKWLGEGSGLGFMDFAFMVANQEQAQKTIEQVIRKHLPKAEFTIDVGDLEEYDDEDESDVSIPKLIGCLAILTAIIGGLVWGIWKFVF